MAVKWMKVEANIYQDSENPKKFRVDLYFGRDERGKIIKSKKVVEGNLTDARKYLRNHESQRDKKILQKPTKITLNELLDNWNSNIGDVQNAETTQTSTKNLQRHMLEYFGDVRVDRLNTSSVRAYMAYLKNQYKEFLKKNGFKHIRYHDLRHTNLSMLMTKMSAVDVAKIGGHKQVSTTTDIYGHSFDDSVERGTEAMNDIMGDVLKKSGGQR